MHEWEVLDDTRELNTWQSGTLARLLSVEFPGSIELREQIPLLRVKEMCRGGCGSVIFEMRPTLVPASTDERVPVEGSAVDSDGMPIKILLHVLGGRLSEIELFRGDSGPILRFPEPDEISVVVAG